MHFLICDGRHLFFPPRPASRSGNSSSVDYD